MNRLSYRYMEPKGERHVSECVQQSGEAIFVPSAWAHAKLTINIETSIGAAFELAWGSLACQ